MSYSVSNKPVGNIQDLGCTQLKTKQQSKTSKQTKLTHTTLFHPVCLYNQLNIIKVTHALMQQSPTFLAPRTGFIEDTFPWTGSGWGWGVALG